MYRTFTGFVKFDPEERAAAGQYVRSFVIRATGVKDQAIDVRCTLWPSHEDFSLEKNDGVLVEGKFKFNKAKNKDGETVTYFNLSVSNIVNLGPGDRGVREETTNTKGSKNDDTADDDDIPY